MVLKKMKEQVEEIDDIKKEGLWGFIFLHNTKFSSFERTKILYWMSVLEGLFESFKFNLCYNIIIFFNKMLF